MGFINDLVRVYDENKGQIGIIETMENGATITPLLPIAHGTLKVNVEINISGDGRFLRAKALSKNEAMTIIPMTEASSIRTSGAVPHPLVDKLQYIAPDYTEHGGSKTTTCVDPTDSDKKKKRNTYECYIEGLSAWADSEYGTKRIKAVRDYLKKGTLIDDLIGERVLVADEKGKLLDKKTVEAKCKEDNKDLPLVFSTLANGDQSETAVRFVVDGVSLSSDKETWDSFINFTLNSLDAEGISYISGNKVKLTSSNPAKIRNQGDGAKLISSNDAVNYTYRGRFLEAPEVYSIGYEESQKAHDALRWLISKQGTAIDDMVFVAWGISELPNVCENTYNIIAEDDDFFGNDIKNEEEISVSNVKAKYANALSQRIMGYNTKLGDNSEVYIMMLDSATPGRLSIAYYREIESSRFLKNVELWHTDYSWLLYQYVSTEEKGKAANKFIPYWGTPSLYEIAKLVNGKNAKAKSLKKTISRLIPCVSGGKPLPYDIMHAAATKYIHAGHDMSQKEAFSYRKKVLGEICALVSGYYNRKDGDTDMDENYDRSYIFGQILACAEQVEKKALIKQSEESGIKEIRETNAERMLPAYVQHPASTLKLLNEKLEPYKKRLTKENSGSQYGKMLELIAKIPKDDFNNKPLNEKYLLGYAKMKMDFQEKNKAYKSTEKENGGN